MEWNLSKRQFLSGAGVSAAAVMMAGKAWIAPEAQAATRPSLAIFDSRLPESVQFAAQARADGLRLFDIAHEDATMWARGRAGFGLAGGEAVAGMTRWSDWLIVRDLLNETGRRVRHEMRMDCCATGDAASYARLTAASGQKSRADLRSERSTTLFAWTMA